MVRVPIRGIGKTKLGDILLDVDFFNRLPHLHN